MGIFPDNFIMLQQNDQFSCERIIENLSSEDSVVQCKDMESVEELAINAVVENNIHMEGVKQVCKGFITELDGTKSVQQILEEIARVLKLKNTKAPRRPQRIILMGPPGSETESQARKIAQKYKLVYVQVMQMFKDAIRREGDTVLAQDLATRLQNNEPCK